MNNFKNINDELTYMMVEHALTMSYLRVTDVLIKCNELDYDLYNKLRDELRDEMDRLKLEMLKRFAIEEAA